MIEETCTEIGELEAHWVAERDARMARRRKIYAIDQLIDEFEKLNLADEHDVPIELIGRAAAVIGSETHPVARRTAGDVAIAEWMDALYDVQDGLMFSNEEEPD